MSILRRSIPALFLGLLACLFLWLSPAAWADGSTVEELQAAVDRGDNSFILTGDLTVPKGAMIRAQSTAVVVPKGKTLIMNGGILELSTLRLVGGKIEVRNGSIFRVNEKLDYSSGTVEIYNGYNLFRVGKLNDKFYPAPVNCVDLCTTNGGNQGKVTINTDNPIQSGELCYLLNGDQSEITWTQDLGVEDMPNMWGTTSQVFQAGTVNCAGASVGTINYNNVSGETVQLDHNINDEIGMCDVCHTQFQEPALVDGYYQIKNAGNLDFR